MDQETRAAFDALMGVTTANDQKTEKCLRLLEHHDERMTRLEEDNARIKAQVFPSEPPGAIPAAVGAAAANGAHPPAPTVRHKISEHDSEIVNLAGQVQALRDEMATKKEVAEIKTDLTTVKDINVAQNNTYGISKKEAPWWKKLGKFLGSRDGRNFLLTVLIAVLTALGYKTATDTKQATADVEKSIQRAEENVVRTTLSAAPHASVAAPPVANTSRPTDTSRAKD